MELKPLFNQIVDAIHEKDGASGGIAAKDFPERIRDIYTGWTDEPLNPAEVYQVTRPGDWLPMPLPADNEMYLLAHIPEGGSSLLAFTVACTGDYTVETGTVQDGAFVPSGSVSVPGGSRFETELFAKDLPDQTADGMRQVMLRVSGADILTWETSPHSRRTGCASWPIMEIRCRLPKGTAVRCGKEDWWFALMQLRYFSWEGPNQLVDMTEMFTCCMSMAALLCLDASKVTNMNRAFLYCHSLRALPLLDTAQVTDMSFAFSYCESLPALPPLDTHNVTTFENAFRCCYTLRSLPPLDTSKAEVMKYMASTCYSLTHIPPLDTSKAKTVKNMFSADAALCTLPELDLSSAEDVSGLVQNTWAVANVPRLKLRRAASLTNIFSDARSLTHVRLDPSVTDWSGCALSLSGCSLGHDAIVDLFNSLPTITSEKTLTLTGNPGVSQLTAEEKAIATGKRWTLAL